MINEGRVLKARHQKRNHPLGAGLKRYGRLTTILVLLLLSLLRVSAAAEKALSIPVKVSEILVRFPAQSSVEKISLAAEVFGLGEAGIMEICRRLSPPGKADDSLARYALEAAGTYAMRPGGERDRSLYARAVVKALNGAPDPDVKTFLVGRLQQAGGNESLEPLSRLLSDRRLADAAVQALLAIRAPGTDEALLKALGHSEEPNTVTLLMAIGELRSRGAIGRIIPFASSQDLNIREAGLFALANIGDPRTEFQLSRIDIASSPREKASSASRYLLFARRLFENGRKDDAFRICRSLLEKCTGPEESQVRSAALTLLTQVSGKDALPDLVKAMDSPDPAFRARALDLSLEIPGEDATAQWIAKTPEILPEAREQIIRMLGRRADRTALGFITDGLKSDDKAIRIAAIEAAARLAGSNIGVDLTPLWQTADAEDAEALERAFLSFPTEVAVPEVVKAFDGASLSAKAAIIEILSQRRTREHAGIVLAAAGNEDDSIRKRALSVLKDVVREEDLPQIIRLLQAAAEPFAIVSLQNAIVASAQQIIDPEKRADLIIETMSEARGQKRIDLLRPLNRVGGEKALRAVIAETQSADPQVRSVAVYTLANWTEFKAAEELLKIAKAESSGAGRKFVYIALQGYIRLVTETDGAADQKLALIRNALMIAREPAEMNIILDSLGRIRSGESLSMIARFLEEPALRGKAAQSAVECALPSPGFEGLIGFETARILKRAAQFIGAEFDCEQVEKYANALLIKEGFVPLFNGKDLSGWKGLVKDPPARARMTLGTLKKEQQAADEDMRRHWQVIDGTLVFDGRGNSLCTAEDYADFELFVDWKIEPQGDSGIYLRGSPQVQIWDPGQWPEGSGGLYNNKVGPAKPLLPADKPVGEWNTFYLRMLGERVTVYLNGALVVDDAVMENYWERDKPVYPAGQIELQAHSTPLYFKNIYIRELR
jgi:HEAT repeat protein